MVLPQLAVRMMRAGTVSQLAVSIGSPPRLTELLLDDRLEFCFGSSDQFDSSEVVTRKIGGVPFALITRSGHPLAGRDDLVVRDLIEFPIVDSSHRFGDYFFNMELPGVTCDNHDILRLITLESDSIWVSSPAFVLKDLQEGTLTTLNVWGLNFEYNQISVISPKARTLSPAANQVIAEVEAILRDLPPANPSAK